MPVISRTVRTALRVTGAVAPPLAVEAAFTVFRGIGPRAPVRDADRAVHLRARRAELTVRGERVVTYTWGDPAAPAVVLSHGWRSRASRFATLVGDLEEAGLRVVAFDGIAHGDSTGTRTTILDHLEILRRIGDAEGELAAVVGHSIGALAAGLAVHEGLPARRFAGIATPAGFDAIDEAFLAAAGLPARLLPAFHERVARGLFPGEPDPRGRFDLVAHPVPVPSLFVHDVDDRALRRADGRRLQAAHPGCELLVTGGLGHNRVLDDADVRDAVVGHLTSVWIAV